MVEHLHSTLTPEMKLMRLDRIDMNLRDYVACKDKQLRILYDSLSMMGFMASG
jgi:hypothetical protein